MKSRARSSPAGSSSPRAGSAFSESESESENGPGCPPEDRLHFLDQIAETMREVIWTSDETGKKVFYVNPAYEKVTGRSVRELYSNPASWHDLLHPDDRARVRAFAPIEGAGDSSEFRLVRPDGETRWLWLHRTPVRDHGGASIGVVGVVEDITERKRAELDLKHSESLLRAALEATADGLLIVDGSGRVSGYNRQFLDLWNIPDKMAADRNDDELLAYVVDQLADPDAFLTRVKRVYASPALHSFDVLNFRDGRVVERYSRPQMLASQIVGRVWSFRDVSARAHAEAALRGRNRRLDIQTRVLFDLARRRVRHRADLKIVLPEITEAAAAMLDVERASVWMFDESHARIRTLELFERSRGRHSAGAVIERSSCPAYFTAMEVERTIAADDPSSDPRTKELGRDYLEPLGITSMLDAPIRDGRGLAGVACFEHVGAPRQWTAEERTFAGSIADLVSLALEADEVQRSEEDVQLLLEATRVLASSINYRTTLANVARLAVPTLADWCIVSVIEDGTLKRVAIAHVDPAKEALIDELERRYPESRSSTPAVHAVRTGEAEFVPEVTEELMADRTADSGHRIVVEKLGLRSYMAVPLIARGVTLGAVTFASANRTMDMHDLALAKDIAARSATAIDNARLHAEVVRADHAKNNFLAVMSHELRTPLSAIVGYAGLLEEGIPDAVTPGQLQHVRGIRTNSAKLLRVIEEILDFSRLEAGEESFRYEEVELQSIVDDVSATVQPLVEQRGLEYVPRVTEGGARIRTDAGKVRQILIHLILNAVKFTRAGSVELSAMIEDSTATFDVRDTGIGVPPELQEKIFDPFFQASDPLTREVGGTGIGLAVARGLARRLGGDVTVAMRTTGGSTFTLTVPDRPEDPAGDGRG